MWFGVGVVVEVCLVGGIGMCVWCDWIVKFGVVDASCEIVG